MSLLERQFRALRKRKGPLFRLHGHAISSLLSREDDDTIRSLKRVPVWVRLAPGASLRHRQNADISRPRISLEHLFYLDQVASRLVAVDDPKYGYVGVGTVTGEAVPFRYAEVLLDGTTRLADLPLQGTYGSPQDTTESAEYVVPVNWNSTTTRERAYRQKGMFANQNSACPLRNQFTIDQLAAFFGIEA